MPVHVWALSSILVILVVDKAVMGYSMSSYYAVFSMAAGIID